MSTNGLLTADEIDKKQFSLTRKFGPTQGYIVEEVDAYLDDVARTFKKFAEHAKPETTIAVNPTTTPAPWFTPAPGVTGDDPVLLPLQDEDPHAAYRPPQPELDPEPASREVETTYYRPAEGTYSSMPHDARREDNRLPAIRSETADDVLRIAVEAGNSFKEAARQEAEEIRRAGTEETHAEIERLKAEVEALLAELAKLKDFERDYRSGLRTDLAAKLEAVDVI